jgi:hypothetical protein
MSPLSTRLSRATLVARPGSFAAGGLRANPLPQVTGLSSGPRRRRPFPSPPRNLRAGVVALVLAALLASPVRWAKAGDGGTPSAPAAPGVATPPRSTPTTSPAAPPTTTTTPVTEADFRARIRYLACEELGGRMSTEPGGFAASQYVADEFKRLGLKPVGDDGGYFQGFAIDMPRLADGNALEVTADGVKTPFEVEKDWNPIGASPNAEIAGDVVFAGYGVTDEERKYDDYAGLDVTGKIVVLIRREPPRKGGPSEHATFRAKLQNAASHHAAAVIVFNNTQTVKAGPNGEARDAILHWSESLGFVPGSALIPFAFVTRKTAAKILTPLGKDVEALQAAIDGAEGGPKPASAAVRGVALRIKTAFEHKKEKNARNVAGLFVGRDPKLRDEVVVVGAHHDHVGRGFFGSAGGPTAQGQIHPGADDNASGTSALLEMAEALAGDDEPPRRSILFLSFSGEELGLLGSAYYVEHPLIPLKQVIAMVNCDMVGRYDPARTLQIGGVGSGKGLQELVDKANGRYGLSLSWDPSGVAPSDNTSFFLKKIPVLFFFTGIHDDYHTPRDTWDKIDAKDGAKVTSLCYDVVETLAEREEGVEYTTPPKTQSNAAALNIIPSPGSDTGGVVVGSVDPDGAAGKAGMLEGDVITAMGLLVVKDLRDLRKALNAHKPGEEVVVKVLRAGKELALKVTLGSR